MQKPLSRVTLRSLAFLKARRLRTAAVCRGATKKSSSHSSHSKTFPLPPTRSSSADRRLAYNTSTWGRLSHSSINTQKRERIYTYTHRERERERERESRLKRYVVVSLSLAVKVQRPRACRCDSLASLARGLYVENEQQRNTYTHTHTANIYLQCSARK